MAKHNYRLVHIHLACTDMERTQKFYEDIFDAKVICTWIENGHKCAIIRIGDGVSLEVFECSSGEREENARWAHIAITCDDPKAAFADAAAKGAAVKHRPTDIAVPCDPPISTVFSFILGPDGEEIEICGPELQ